MYRPFFKIVQNSSTKKGFTLIETLVAISILMLAVTGPLVISQKGLSAAAYAKDQMIAYYLAQDAMEYVRNVRDTNVLNSVTDWLSVLSVVGVANGLFNPCNNQGCTIDTRPAVSLSSVVAVCSNPCARLIKITSVSDVQYGYGPGDITPFSRTVKIEKPVLGGGNIIQGDIEAKVTVTVTWSTFSGERNVTLVENLFKQS